MTTLREAAQQALEKIGKAHAKVSALCSGDERWTMSVPVRPDYDHDVVISDALYAASEALRAALAEPQGEPVAWVERDGELVWNNRQAAIGRNLYTVPQPKAEQEPVAEEIDRLVLDRSRHRRIHAAIQGRTSHQGRDLEQYMNIIELAREAGLYVGTNLSGVMLVGHAKHDGLLIHLDVADLERFATLVRAAALEEAAVVCETRWTLGIGGQHQGDVLAAAIRAMKEQV